MGIVRTPEYSVKPPFVRADGPLPMLSGSQCAALLSAARAGSPGDMPPGASVWRHHAMYSQRPLADAIEANDPAALSAVLDELHTSAVLKGFDQPGSITAALDAEAGHRHAQGSLTYHTLMRLAAALGIKRAWNPEQRDNFPYLAEDETEAAVAGIRSALGVTRAFPHTTQGAYGLRTAHGLLTHRQILTLGYLREVDAHLARTGRDYAHVVEIGGGLGRMAFNLAARADRPVTVIDLPLVGVMQSAFLTANGIPATLWPARLDPTPGHVNIVSAFDMAPVAGLRRALFLNFDGLVEMARESVDAYFELIRATRSDLLSVNHEAARVTGTGARQEWQIARIAEYGLAPQPRTAFWERDGYVAQSFLAPRRRGLMGHLGL